MSTSTAKTRVPETRGVLDRLAIAAIVVGAVLTAVGFLMAFLVVPPVNGASVGEAVLVGDVVVANKLLLSQKIFYFHMPVALVSFGALAFAADYSVRFLMTRNARFDTCAKVAMEIALVRDHDHDHRRDVDALRMGRMVDVEPRLTTYLVLMLIVIATWCCATWSTSPSAARRSRRLSASSRSSTCPSA